MILKVLLSSLVGKLVFQEIPGIEAISNGYYTHERAILFPILIVW